MKKIITCGIAAALCASALSTQAFATDITEDMSIFADNADELAATVKVWDYNGESLTLDPKTIMQEYYADLKDFVDTGKLVVSDTFPRDGKRFYYADVIDSSGKFAGHAEFKEPVGSDNEISVFLSEYAEDPITYEKYKQCSSAYFHLFSEEVKSLLIANGISPDIKEVKVLFLDGVGPVYYINTGTEEVLVPAREGYGGFRDGYFEDLTKDIIVVNEEFRVKAALMLDEDEKLNEEYSKVNEGVAGGTGTGSEGSKNDNPNTGADDSAQTTKRMAVLAVELSALAAAGIGITVINKKRKNGN